MRGVGRGDGGVRYSKGGRMEEEKKCRLNFAPCIFHSDLPLLSYSPFFSIKLNFKQLHLFYEPKSKHGVIKDLPNTSLFIEPCRAEKGAASLGGW